MLVRVFIDNYYEKTITLPNTLLSIEPDSSSEYLKVSFDYHRDKNFGGMIIYIKWDKKTYPKLSFYNPNEEK